MDLPDSAMFFLSPAPLAVACATITLLTAHLVSPSARATTTFWALGALVCWPTGAALWAWLAGSGSLERSWQAQLWQAGFAPAGGLLALLVWTLWSCRRRPALQGKLCLVLMMASGLWWGLEQWRTALPTPLAGSLPAVTLESLEGRPVTPDRTASAHYLLLWRSDCRPCRQWLQRLAEQPAGRRPELTLVNQGEPLLAVLRYLDQHPDQRLGLEDTSLLLDPGQRLLALTGHRRLPVLLHVAPDNTLTRAHDLSVMTAAIP
ncbi:hypothetical protein ACUN8C_02515 [Kushneria sp. Sum13]|uniref:hypothetical protein n=1 Tax=Kushneria sp. Sum13 TaxID=3459196 RepID=UPI0040451AC8